MGFFWLSMNAENASYIWWPVQTTQSNTEENVTYVKSQKMKHCVSKPTYIYFILTTLMLFSHVNLD